MGALAPEVVRGGSVGNKVGGDDTRSRSTPWARKGEGGEEVQIERNLIQFEPSSVSSFRPLFHFSTLNFQKGGADRMLEERSRRHFDDNNKIGVLLFILNIVLLFNIVYIKHRLTRLLIEQFYRTDINRLWE